MYVAGSCGDKYNTIIIDEYNVADGELLYRTNNSITKFSFGITVFNITLPTPEFGLIPPDITLVSPGNDTLQNELIGFHEIYFYMSVTHILFQGYTRVTKNLNTNEYTVHKFLWRELNPSVFTHKSIVAIQNDSSILTLNTQGFLGDLIENGTTKNLEKWETKLHHPYTTKTIREESVYKRFTWYGNDNYGLKKTFFSWNLIMNTYNYDNAYLISSPIVELTQPSHIAKHDVINGDVTGGISIDKFYMMDGVVNSDGNLIVVGFKWNADTDGIKTKNILLRNAQYYIINTTTIDNDECYACEMMYYSDKCQNKCDCNDKGYCRDGINGDGYCYCTLETYGQPCEACDCHFPTGICDNGGNGTGLCKYCYDIEINTTKPLHPHIDFSPNYGAYCNMTCLCDTKFGICDPRGIDGTGECVYCTDKTKFGKYCNNTCDCDDNIEYCQNGIHGLGCIKYDYGGISFKYDNYVYIAVPIILFILFFGFTLHTTKNDFKKNARGNVPCCPRRNKTHKINLLSNQDQIKINSSYTNNSVSNSNNNNNDINQNNNNNNSNNNDISNEHYMRYNV